MVIPDSVETKSLTEQIKDTVSSLNGSPLTLTINSDLRIYLQVEHIGETNNVFATIFRPDSVKRLQIISDVWNCLYENGVKNVAFKLNDQVEA